MPDLDLKWVRVRFVQIGQIRDFYRSYLVNFGSASQNILKSDLKKTRICRSRGQSDPLLSPNLTSLCSCMRNQSLYTSVGNCFLVCLYLCNCNLQFLPGYWLLSFLVISFFTFYFCTLVETPSMICILTDNWKVPL